MDNQRFAYNRGFQHHHGYLQHHINTPVMQQPWECGAWPSHNNGFVPDYNKWQDRSRRCSRFEKWNNNHLDDIYMPNDEYSSVPLDQRHLEYERLISSSKFNAKKNTRGFGYRGGRSYNPLPQYNHRRGNQRTSSNSNITILSDVKIGTPTKIDSSVKETLEETIEKAEEEVIEDHAVVDMEIDEYCAETDDINQQSTHKVVAVQSEESKMDVDQKKDVGVNMNKLEETEEKAKVDSEEVAATQKKVLDIGEIYFKNVGTLPIVKKPEKRCVSPEDFREVDWVLDTSKSYLRRKPSPKKNPCEELRTSTEQSQLTNTETDLIQENKTTKVEGSNKENWTGKAILRPLKPKTEAPSILQSTNVLAKPPQLSPKEVDAGKSGPGATKLETAADRSTSLPPDLVSALREKLESQKRNRPFAISSLEKDILDMEFNTSPIKEPQTNNEVVDNFLEIIFLPKADDGVVPLKEIKTHSLPQSSKQHEKNRNNVEERRSSSEKRKDRYSSQKRSRPSSEKKHIDSSEKKQMHSSEKKHRDLLEKKNRDLSDKNTDLSERKNKDSSEKKSREEKKEVSSEMKTPSRRNSHDLKGDVKESKNEIANKGEKHAEEAKPKKSDALPETSNPSNEGTSGKTPPLKLHAKAHDDRSSNQSGEAKPKKSNAPLDKPNSSNVNEEGTSNKTPSLKRPAQFQADRPANSSEEEKPKKSNALLDRPNPSKVNGESTPNKIPSLKSPAQSQDDRPANSSEEAKPKKSNAPLDKPNPSKVNEEGTANKIPSLKRLAQSQDDRPANSSEEAKSKKSNASLDKPNPSKVNEEGTPNKMNSLKRPAQSQDYRPANSFEEAKPKKFNAPLDKPNPLKENEEGTRNKIPSLKRPAKFQEDRSSNTSEEAKPKKSNASLDKPNPSKDNEEGTSNKMASFKRVANTHEDGLSNPQKKSEVRKSNKTPLPTEKPLDPTIKNSKSDKSKPTTDERRSTKTPIPLENSHTVAGTSASQKRTRTEPVATSSKELSSRPVAEDKKSKHLTLDDDSTKIWSGPGMLTEYRIPKVQKTPRKVMSRADIQTLNSTLDDLMEYAERPSAANQEPESSAEDDEVASITSSLQPSKRLRSRSLSQLTQIQEEKARQADRPTERRPATCAPRSRSVDSSSMLIYTEFRVTRSVSSVLGVNNGLNVASRKDTYEEVVCNPQDTARDEATLESLLSEESAEVVEKSFTEEVPYTPPMKIDLSCEVPTVIYRDLCPNDPRRNYKKMVSLENFGNVVAKRRQSKVDDAEGSKKKIARTKKNDDPDYTPHSKINISSRPKIIQAIVESISKDTEVPEVSATPKKRRVENCSIGETPSKRRTPNRRHDYTISIDEALAMMETTPAVSAEKSMTLNVANVSIHHGVQSSETVRSECNLTKPLNIHKPYIANAKSSVQHSNHHHAIMETATTSEPEVAKAKSVDVDKLSHEFFQCLAMNHALVEVCSRSFGEEGIIQKTRDYNKAVLEDMVRFCENIAKKDVAKEDFKKFFKQLHEKITTMAGTAPEKLTQRGDHFREKSKEDFLKYLEEVDGLYGNSEPSGIDDLIGVQTPPNSCSAGCSDDGIIYLGDSGRLHTIPTPPNESPVAKSTRSTPYPTTSTPEVTPRTNDDRNATLLSLLSGPGTVVANSTVLQTTTISSFEILSTPSVPTTHVPLVQMPLTMSPDWTSSGMHNPSSCDIVTQPATTGQLVQMPTSSPIVAEQPPNTRSCDRVHQVTKVAQLRQTQRRMSTSITESSTVLKTPLVSEQSHNPRSYPDVPQPAKVAQFIQTPRRMATSTANSSSVLTTPSVSAQPHNPRSYADVPQPANVGQLVCTPRRMSTSTANSLPLLLSNSPHFCAGTNQTTMIQMPERTSTSTSISSIRASKTVAVPDYSLYVPPVYRASDVVPDLTTDAVPIIERPLERMQSMVHARGNHTSPISRRSDMANESQGMNMTPARVSHEEQFRQGVAPSAAKNGNNICLPPPYPKAQVPLWTPLQLLQFFTQVKQYRELAGITARLCKAARQRSQHIGVDQQNNGVVQQHNGVAQQNNGVVQQHNGVGQLNNGVAHQNNGVVQQHNGVSHQHTGVTQQRGGRGRKRSGVARQHTSAQQHSGVAQQHSEVVQRHNGSAQRSSGVAEQHSEVAQQLSGTAQRHSGVAKQHCGSAQQQNGVAQQRKSLVNVRSPSSINASVADTEELVPQQSWNVPFVETKTTAGCNECSKSKGNGKVTVENIIELVSQLESLPESRKAETLKRLDQALKPTNSLRSFRPTASRASDNALQRSTSLQNSRIANESTQRRPSLQNDRSLSGVLSPTLTNLLEGTPCHQSVGHLSGPTPRTPSEQDVETALAHRTPNQQAVANGVSERRPSLHNAENRNRGLRENASMWEVFEYLQKSPRLNDGNGPTKPNESVGNTLLSPNFQYGEQLHEATRKSPAEQNVVHETRIKTPAVQNVEHETTRKTPSLQNIEAKNGDGAEIPTQRNEGQLGKSLPQNIPTPARSTLKTPEPLPQTVLPIQSSSCLVQMRPSLSETIPSSDFPDDKSVTSPCPNVDISKIDLSPRTIADGTGTNEDRLGTSSNCPSPVISSETIPSSDFPDDKSVTFSCPNVDISIIDLSSPTMTDGTGTNEDQLGSSILLNIPTPTRTILNTPGPLPQTVIPTKSPSCLSIVIPLSPETNPFSDFPDEKSVTSSCPNVDISIIDLCSPTMADDTDTNEDQLGTSILQNIPTPTRNTPNTPRPLPHTVLPIQSPSCLFPMRSSSSETIPSSEFPADKSVTSPCPNVDISKIDLSPRTMADGTGTNEDRLRTSILQNIATPTRNTPNSPQPLPHTVVPTQSSSCLSPVRPSSSETILSPDFPDDTSVTSPCPSVDISKVDFSSPTKTDCTDTLLIDIDDFLFTKVDEDPEVNVSDDEEEVQLEFIDAEEYIAQNMVPDDPLPRNDSVDSGVSSPTSTHAQVGNLDAANGEIKCEVCPKMALFICSCQSVMYCSVNCQSTDWAVHREVHDAIVL